MRPQRPLILILAAAVAALALVAGCGPETIPTLAPLVTPSPTATATATATPTATLGAVVAGETDDPGDEPPASETPALSFTPGPAGPLAPTGMTRLPGEPDPALTPGSLNPAVTQATIGTTICVSGWTATIRPPSSYTTKLKKTQIVQYGYANTATSLYEEDHLISLQLGGNPTDPKNLWPEPYSITLPDGRSAGAHVKDAWETKLKDQVCAHKMTLAEAQAEVGIHWVHFDFPIR